MPKSNFITGSFVAVLPCSFETSGTFGVGATPEEAVKSLRNYEVDAGSDTDMQDVELFEIGRVGKPSVTVVWE